MKPTQRIATPSFPPPKQLQIHMVCANVYGDRNVSASMLTPLHVTCLGLINRQFAILPASQLVS